MVKADDLAKAARPLHSRAHGPSRVSHESGSRAPPSPPLPPPHTARQGRLRPVPCPPSPPSRGAGPAGAPPPAAMVSPLLCVGLMVLSPLMRHQKNISVYKSACP